MDAETLKALKQSIEKWERNAVAETPDDFTKGVNACPLCALFWEDDCVGCPVRGETGKEFCVGSPYDEEPHEDWFAAPNDTTLRDAAHAVARAEVAFLRSLLPEEEGQP